jgi:hypothetical protein
MAASAIRLIHLELDGRQGGLGRNEGLGVSFKEFGAGEVKAVFQLDNLVRGKKNIHIPATSGETIESGIATEMKGIVQF